MKNKSLFALLFATSLLLGGCSYLPSWAGGESRQPDKLAGERIAVLPVNAEVQPDDSLKATAVTLPTAKANAEWAQPGMFDIDSSNLGGGGTFTTDISISAGDGKSFENTQLVRPVVGGGMVFAMDAAGNISAHDAANVASIKWQSKGVSDEDGHSIFGGGLAYDKGRVYATSGHGIVAAFDAATGKEIWRKSLRVPFRSAPKVSVGKLYALTIDNQIYALNIADGEIAWTQRGINETTGLMASVSPAIAGDFIVVPFSSGEIYVMSAANGQEVWSDALSGGKRSQASNLFSGIGGDPVVDGAALFTVSSGGVISARAVAAGQPIWDRPIGSNNTPWLTGDYLYVLSSDNTLLCFVKFDGRIKWATKLASFADEKKKEPITWKGPVMINGKLAVVASNGQLLLVNGTDGKIASRVEIAEEIYTAPVVAGGRIYLVSKDATLHALQ